MTGSDECRPYPTWVTFCEDLADVPHERWTRSQARENVDRLLSLMPFRVGTVLEYLGVRRSPVHEDLLARLDEEVAETMRNCQFSTIVASELTGRPERVPTVAGLCLATDACLLVVSMLLDEFSPHFEMAPCTECGRTYVDRNLPVLRCPNWPGYRWVGFYRVAESLALSLADEDPDPRRSFLGLYRECVRRVRASCEPGMQAD